MADQDLTIRLLLDKSRAQATSKEYHDGERERIAKLVLDHAEAERAKTRQIQEEAAKRAKATRQATKEKAEAEKKAFQEWKAVQDVQHKLAMQAWKEQQKGTAQVNSSIIDAATSVASFGAGMLGLSSATAVINQISENWQRIKQNVLDATGVLQGYRESLLELAALKGNTGQTGKELIDNLKFRAQTGQTQQNSIALQEAAIGVGGGAVDTDKIKKNISQDEFNKAMVFAGKMQAVEGGSADAYGAMVGSLPSLMGGRQDAKSVANQMGRLYEIMKPGGYSLSSGMKQFGQAAPYIKAGITTVDEAAALQSMYSVNERDQAGTRVDQLMRATVGSLERNRHVKGVEGSNNIGTAEYLKGLGAKGGMKPQEIAMLVQQDLAKQKAAQGADFNPMGYLQGKGYGNQEDLLSLINFDTTRWKDTYAPMLGDAKLAQKGTGAVDERLSKDQAFITRRSQYAEELGKMAPGIGKEGVTSLYRAAYGKLKAQNGGKDYGGMGSFEETMNPAWNQDWLTGYNASLKSEVSNMLESEAIKYGIDPKRPMKAVSGGVGGRGVSIKDNYGDDQASQLLGQIQAKGGGTLENLISEMVALQTKALQEAEKQTAIAREQAKPAPIGNVGAKVQPARP